MKRDWIVIGVAIVLTIGGCNAAPAQQPTARPTSVPTQVVTEEVTMPTLPAETITPGPQDVWMTGKMERRDDSVVFIGPDLSNMVGRGEVYTYFCTGFTDDGTTCWVALTWEGYKEGANTWTIPDKLKAERPTWETNQTWSVDFLWPAEKGPYPDESAHPGTSSK
jgi:hypothetical protein